MKCNSLINALISRGLFLGASYYASSGASLYVIHNGRVRFVTLGTARAYLQAIKRREDEIQWQNFGRTHALQHGNAAR